VLFRSLVSLVVEKFDLATDEDIKAFCASIILNIAPSKKYTMYLRDNHEFTNNDFASMGISSEYYSS
jgi:hypothetical protein